MWSQSIRQRFLFSILGMQNQSKEGGTLWKSLLHLFSDAAMADFSGGCGYCHNDITLPRELWLVRVGHPETCENNYEWYFVLDDSNKALTVYVMIQVPLLIDISRYLHVGMLRYQEFGLNCNYLSESVEKVWSWLQHIVHVPLKSFFGGW